MSTTTTFFRPAVSEDRTRTSGAVVNGEEARRIVHGATEAIEEQRHDLALLYAAADGGSAVEHEVGECLTLVRKALARLRKAQGELAQIRLPLDQVEERE